MPDWKKLVQERMGGLELAPDAKEGVISELAAHLEDGYQDEIARGRGESEARQHVLSEVQWNKLAREIRRATRKEASMNNRTRALWLPAIVNVMLAAVLLTILVALGDAAVPSGNICHRGSTKCLMRTGIRTGAKWFASA